MMNKILNSVMWLLFLGQASLASAQKLTGYVDPMIGTGDHGHVFVGANVPFGMVQVGPTEFQSGWDWCSGYHHSSDSIIGFSHLHLSGTGCGDLGDISLMPHAGCMGCCDVVPTRKTLAKSFSHSEEKAVPGYYSVVLNENGGDKIHCEMSATERVAIHRYTFLGSKERLEDQNQSLVIDLENTVSTWDHTTDCQLVKVDSCTISGFRKSRGWARNQGIYFVMKFNRPVRGIDLFDGVKEGAKGKQYGLVSWDADYNTIPLLVKVALSPVSVENAIQNMKTELEGWDFLNTCKLADAKWEKSLSRVKATFHTEREATIFYTSMFHMMVAPQLWCDTNGEYMGADFKVHKADYNHLTTWSLWDTYRAAHPLSTILFPDRSRDYAKTMIDIYRQGGELPVWHLMSNETYCMVGEPAVPVIADLILKGQIGTLEVKEAYKAIKGSLLPESGKERYDYRGKDELQKYGYLPYNSTQNESLAKSLEYYLACWSAAQVAKKLGYKEDYKTFYNLSMNYKKFYDKRVGFVRALDKEGNFRSLDGFNPSHQTSDYTEGNAWQYTFLVPHDVDGLVKLMGGKKAFEQKLDGLFSASSELNGDAAPDISGLVGQYAHGNEPSHHIIYMYNYINKPQKAQALLRKVMNELYSDAPAGLCGNEDVGQMSAWYIMSALGIYQVEPCGGKYQLGSPAVKDAVITVAKGKKFWVRTHGNTASGKVEKYMLNNKKLSRNYILHDEIMNGGVLEVYY